MAVNEKEGFGEKVKEFFTQNPDDHEYEKAGGDSRVPKEQRKGDPKREANSYAVSHGEEPPYPGH